MSAQVEFEGELRVGLPNMWYPICQSEHVKEKPLGLMRLGRDIVVWRDSIGNVHVHDDRCLHRGQMLSQQSRLIAFGADVRDAKGLIRAHG